MSNEQNTKQSEELTIEQQEEMQKMIEKLKEIGNSVLNFVGLSSDDFTVTKDESTGGFTIEHNPSNK